MVSYNPQERYVNNHRRMFLLLGDCLELVACKLPRVTWA